MGLGVVGTGEEKDISAMNKSRLWEKAAAPQNNLFWGNKTEIQVKLNPSVSLPSFRSHGCLEKASQCW